MLNYEVDQWEEINEQFREPIADSVRKFEEADGATEAAEWLQDNDINPAALPFAIKLVGVTASRDFDIGLPEANGTVIYTYNESGADREFLAFPVIENGEIRVREIDIVSGDFKTVRQKADWLGRESIVGEVVRLHRSPLDWLSSGGTGCCSVHPYQRSHMKALQAVPRIECNDVAVALEAWEWDSAPTMQISLEFEIDDTEENIRGYFEAQAAARVLSEKHPGRFNLVMA